MQQTFHVRLETGEPSVFQNIKAVMCIMFHGHFLAFIKVDDGSSSLASTSSLDAHPEDL
jgi:hypothetical protein